MNRKVKIALGQVNSVAGEKSSNLAKLRAFVVDAAENGAEIVCFPELSVTGYIRDRSTAQLAEPIPGPSTEELVRMATETGLTILAGLLERDLKGNVFNTHVVAEPGRLLGTHRKLYIPRTEAEGFVAGRDFGVFQTKDLVIGIEVCFDAHFPELSTALALLGADVLFLPHASAGGEPYQEKRARWMRFLPARAYDNAVYIAVCNLTGRNGAGEDCPGISFVCDPLGNIVAESDGPREQLLVVELAPEIIDRARRDEEGYFLRYRRPDLYASGKARSRN